MSLFFLAAPWFFGDLWLQRVSSLRNDFLRLERGLHSNMKDQTVLIGDCSITHLVGAQMHGGFENVLIFGFGGSSIKEWYYLVKNNRELFNGATRVVIATVHAARFTYLYNSYTSFLPFLMTWRDIYDYAMKEDKISFQEMLRFYLAKLFISYSGSQTMRYRLLDYVLPQYRPWFDASSQQIVNRNARAPNVEHQDIPWIDVNSQTNPDEYMNKLIQLSRTMKPKLVYLLNPRSRTVMSDSYKRERADWLHFCDGKKIPCFDMSSALPESDFQPVGDGVHIVQEKAQNEFWRLFNEEFTKRGLAQTN